VREVAVGGWLRGFPTGVRDGQRKEQKSKEQRAKSKEQKSKRLGRHAAEPGRAGVLRIETDGVVSTQGAFIADATEWWRD